MKKKRKGKRIKNVKRETLILPEELIQHIQSFMRAKEAARSAILSKSWHNAWLTRPTIVLHDGDFGYHNYEAFEEFAMKTMQRYRDSNLKISSFNLCCRNNDSISGSNRHNMIVGAINIGATHLKLYLPLSSFTLPQEVLGSQTLVKLFLDGFRIDDSYVINCSMLKSLTLESVHIRSDDVFKDLTSRCVSMEELSLSNCFRFELKRTNMYELHKLRRLFLSKVNVDNMFFTGFASRFPCLKDLTIHHCNGCTRIHIATTSLQTISFEPKSGSDSAKFDVPNIRKFTYSAPGLPSNLSINGASSWEWELDISIICSHFHETSWFMNLKNLLNEFRLSRISLFIDLRIGQRRITDSDSDHAVDVEVVPEPLVVENLTIAAPPTFCCDLLLRLFGAFRPKFIIQSRPHRSFYYPRVIDARDRLIELLFISNWEDMFGQFGLKKVIVEIYKEFDKEWRPLWLKKRPLRLNKPIADSNAKVRLQLTWED